MNEFFREVDEDFRRDQVAKFWKRWGGLIIGAVVIVVVGVAGWRYWDYLETTRAQEAAARFYEAQQQIEQANVSAGQGALEELAASDGGGGYALLARFRLAASQGQQDSDAGALAYDALADDANVPVNLRDFARLRAALLRLDTQYETAAAQLQSLAAPENAYRHSAREALGLAALKRGDFDAAGNWFDQLAMDGETPQALRGRLEIYSALVAAGPLQPTQ